MERDYVQSSMITSYGYDATVAILEIEFIKGAVWQYADVPESVFYEMQACDSCGKFFHANIKGRYPESQVG